MKILALSNLYPPDFIGGYELACAQAVDGLRAMGHEVRVLTTAPRSPVPHDPSVDRTMKLTDIWNLYHFQRSNSVTQHLYNAESSFVNAFNVHGLLRALDEFRPDVVYVCNLVGLGGLGLMACLQYLGVPWVWQLGDRVPNYLCSRWDRVVPELAREFSRQLQGHFVVVSRQLAEEIEACGATLNGPVEILPNWIHFERPIDRTSYFRGEHLRIVTAGRIESIKGIDLLIESAAKLREWGHENFSIDIYGKVTDPSFQCQIQKLGVAEHVSLKGVLPQADLFEKFSEYDVFAFPTQDREPFGLAPLEAAAFGCVPVMSQTCGIAEWLVHGAHCLKAARSPTAFARAFQGILTGEVELEPMARRVASVVRREFHIDHVLPRVEAVLDRASRQVRRPSGTADEAYRLALLAEKLTQLLVQESLVA